MERTFDGEALTEAMQPFSDETAGFNPREWIADPDNIALTDGKGNFNLFQYDTYGVYWAHTYFNTARGKEAIDLCRSSLAWVFSDDSPVQVIKGITPLYKQGARWLNRKLGLQSHGIIKTRDGTGELFILDKHTYLERVN